MNIEQSRVMHSALDAGADGFSHQDDVREALRAVIAMHQPRDFGPDSPRLIVCRHCMDQPYPCRTVTAVAAVLRVRLTLGQDATNLGVRRAR